MWMRSCWWTWLGERLRWLVSERRSLPDCHENYSRRGAGSLSFVDLGDKKLMPSIEEQGKSSLVKKVASRQDEKNSAWKRGCREA